MRKVAYGRVIYVEPNDMVASTSGSISLDNVTWDPEDINMSVDLQVIVPRRSDFGSYTDGSGNKSRVEIWHEGMSDVDRYISFMQGSDIKNNNGTLVGHELTTDYINASYSEITSQGQSCKEALGIDSIDITFDQHFYPRVSIRFIDVRGYSLMMPTDEIYRLEHTNGGVKGGYINFFRALFHYPYPRFLLTVKGFYGSSVTFQLAVDDFKNNFNSDTGNFEITVSFIGYMYGLYTDVPFNLLISAPYYNPKEVSQIAGTYSSWGGPNFVYDSGNGSVGRPIYTFVEFLEQCNKLNDAIAKTKNNSSQYTNLGTASKNSVKITALGELKEKLKNYIDETRKLNKRTNDKSYIVENEGYDVIFFQVVDTTAETTTSGSTEEDKSFFGFDINTKKAAEWWSENMANNKIKVAITQWNIFAKAWDDYNKEDNLGIPKWQPGGTLSKDNVYYLDVKEDEQTYYEPFYANRKVKDNGEITADKNSTSGGGITIDYLIKHDPSLRDKILRSEYATRPVYYLMGSVIAKIIDDKINELRIEQGEIQPIAKSELESLYKDNLGFNPSVLNMYRMIFAHLSCFMELFYDTIKEIKSNEDSRRLANFGVTKDKIDVSSYMSENAIVPPFPAIFKNDESENNRRVQIYPGEIPELVDKMPELRLVEGLINGTLGLKDRVRQIICDTHEKVTFNQESEMAAKDTDYNYTPTAISDFMHDSNPYVSVLSGSGYDLMVCMMSRMVSASLQLYMSDTDPSTSLANIGDIESRNFVKLHPESSGGSKLKQDLLSMSDGFKQNETEVFNKFISYWNAQGLNGAQYKDGELIFNIENAPIYSEGYPPVKQTSVLVGSDGYVPLNGANSGKVFFTERRAVNGFDNINKFIEKIKEQQNKENQNETQLTGSYGNLTEGTTGVRMLRLTTTPPEMNMLSGTIQKKDKINRIPDVLNITYSSDNYSKDAYYAFHDKKDGKFVFPFHDFTNENGDIFFSKRYKNDLDDYEKAGLFLMYLNANAFGLYRDKIQNSNTEVLIPDLANTSICVARYAAICLLGYALWKDIDSTVITSPIPTCSLHFVFCNERNRISEKKYNETKFKRIYNNTELKKKIIGIFEEFVKSSSWKNIYTSLSNREKYKKDDDGNIATSPYCLSYKQKEIIYDEMLSEGTDIAIYVINNETKYKNSAAIKIPKERFMKAVEFMVTHYGGIETEYERTDPNFGKSDVSNAHRLALYNSLKNLYDKWGNSYQYSDFILRDPGDDRKKKQDRFEKGIAVKDGCEFDNFIFVDCYYNDISDKYRMNPSILSDIIAKQVQAEANASMMECMADMMQKNHMLFLALPVYSNFYKFETIHNMFMPKPEETMLTGIGATYVGMYTYEVSHVVEDNRFEDHLDGDYLMIADLNGIDDDPRPTEIGQQVFSYGGKGLSIPVPAFGVTYARQNQGYFKKIDVNMDNPRVTDYSLYNLFALTNSVNGNELNKPLTVANDIYSIYANRSYNCTVEMMGCANIMPMMYFQLNNIPMFRGAYMISNVEHHISAGNFTTKFSGVRVCKNQLPYVQDLFDCNNNFDFSGYGLTESPYTYDGGYNNINYTIPRDCDWDPRAAIRMMYYSRNYLNGSDRGSIDTLFSNKGGTAPLPNGSMKGGCAASVKTFIKAGFAQIALDSSRSKEERDKAREKAQNAPGLFVNGWDLHKDNAVREMAKCGFELKYRTKATTKEGMNKELKEFGLKDGDILTTLMGDRTDWGHVHMWNSDIQKWVSDGPSKNAYVYNEKGGYHEKKKINYGPIKPDCGWLFRYVGCDTSKIQVAAANINTSNNNGLPKGDIYRPERGKQPYEPYRIFNISRDAAAAKRLPINLSKITSYDSLQDKYKKGDAGTENQKSTTHRDAQGACNLFVYYVKDRYLDKGIKTLQEYIYTYVASYAKKQYLADAILYFTNRFKKNFTPQSEIVWTKEFICALGEFQAMREQGVNVTGTLMTTAWNNIQNYLNDR